jgi:hypothetical protein
VTPSYLSAGFKPHKALKSAMFAGALAAAGRGRMAAFRTGLTFKFARSVMTTSNLPQDFEKDRA